MTKSPVNWIKRVLFRRESPRTRNSRKHKGQKAEGDGLVIDGKEPSLQGGTYPVISHPVLVTASLSTNSDTGNNLPSSIRTDVVSDSRDLFDNQGNIPVCDSKCADQNELQESEAVFLIGKTADGKAAIRVQAAFRGYLTRRAFRALRGIVKLQAHIRGNLVRRQAAASLLFLCGIIELQAVVRGQLARLSKTGIQVAKSAFEDVEKLNSINGTALQQERYWSSNQFACKIISSVDVAKPLQMHYANDEPNSFWAWLERWNSCHFWKPTTEIKETTDTKSESQHISNGLQVESGLAELHTPKVRSRKVTTKTKIATSQSVIDEQKIQIQTEHSKVSRRTGRKMRNPVMESNRTVGNTNKSMLAVGRISSSVTNSSNPGQVTSENKKIDASNSDPGLETDVQNHTSASLEVLNASGKEHWMENGSMTSNGEQQSKEILVEIQTEQSLEECTESSLSLKSYMASTASMKAKSYKRRSKIKPAVIDEKENGNGFTARRSPAPSSNGKMGHRAVQPTAKGGVKNHRSLSSSKDKLIQVEWRL